MTRGQNENAVRSTDRRPADPILVMLLFVLAATVGVFILALGYFVLFAFPAVVVVHPG